MSEDLAASITRYVTAYLLRYFRPAIAAETHVDHLDHSRDVDLLRLQWSLSRKVDLLAEYILQHRHEMQSFLATRKRSEPGILRGRIDARATLMNRLITSNPSIIVTDEPVRSFDSGPNHVTAWVLQQAWMLASRFRAMLPQDATYRASAGEVVKRLEEIRKLAAISTAMGEVNLTRRPSADAVRAAGQSRRQTYRLAYNAYQSLAAIEAGHTTEIEAVLRDTLVAPLEIWRRFELATALAFAEALGNAANAPVRLNVLAGDTRLPVATIGQHAIYWQSRTRWHTEPAPEPSEVVTRDVLAAYGLRPDSDRPDLVIANLDNDSVVAVVEVKYFTAAA